MLHWVGDLIKISSRLINIAPQDSRISFPCICYLECLRSQIRGFFFTRRVCLPPFQRNLCRVRPNANISLSPSSSLIRFNRNLVVKVILEENERCLQTFIQWTFLTVPWQITSMRLKKQLQVLIVIFCLTKIDSLSPNRQQEKEYCTELCLTEKWVLH